MRKSVAVLLTITLLTSLFGCAAKPARIDGEQTTTPGEPTLSVASPDFVPHTPDNFKGVWLSQWDMQRVYVKGGAMRDETDFRARSGAIMENAASVGFNTILIQVRPFGDSFYPSDLYPPSSMAVGAYGQTFSYDPFAILVENAHRAGLSVHAWINPLRLEKTGEIEAIDASFPIRRWYDDSEKRGKYLVLQPDGRWYLNPGYPEVRELIVSGAREILERYEVDGLHLDDYFYPTTDEAYDRACFAEAKQAQAGSDLASFRRGSLNQLVRALYETVHETRPGALFGIAPGGNLDDTYSCKYADIYTWCGEDPCVDYLCPEIYFGFEHEFCPFDKTALLWSQTVQNPAVKLYLGLSFHKASLGYDTYAGSGAYEWVEHSDILARSLSCALTIENCSGVCVFSYQHFFNALTGEEPEWTRPEREGFLPLLKNAVFLAA